MRNYSKYKRGQSSLEFMLLVGAVLFFFITFIFSLQINISDKIKEKRNLLIKDVASTVQDEINLALKTSDGYSRTFDLPRDIINKNYTVQIIDESVYVKTDDGKEAISLPVANVTGQPNIGTNSIRKTDGRIYLNS